MSDPTKVVGLEPTLETPLEKVIHLLEGMKEIIPNSNTFDEKLELDGEDVEPFKHSLNTLMVDTSCAVIDAQLTTFRPFLELEKHYLRLIELKAMYRVLNELNQNENTQHKTLVKVISMLDLILVELDEIKGKLSKLKPKKN